MNKKPMIFLSTVAAIPGAILLVFLVMGLLQGILSDGSSVSVVLWIVWILAVLGSLTIAVLPILIHLLPGLMPESVVAAAPIGSSMVGMPGTGMGNAPADSEEMSEDEGFASSDTDETGDDGEQIFDDGALEDDFEDDLGSFDDDEKS